MGPERKTVRVHLRVDVLCDVDVSAPNEDGQADVHAIRLADTGNILQELWTDPASLSEDEYAAIDKAAAKAFGVEPTGD